MGKFDRLKAQIAEEKKPDPVPAYFAEVDAVTVPAQGIPVSKGTETATGKPKKAKEPRTGVQFRALPQDVEKWGLYAKLAGFEKMQDFYCAAVNEYLENHPLTDDAIRGSMEERISKYQNIMISRYQNN